VIRRFRIVSSAAVDHGVWPGADPAEALAAMHREVASDAILARDGEVVFPDEETARICGGLDVWSVREVQV
jgi:hypothetical protein